jgi:hypothetical protein
MKSRTHCSRGKLQRRVERYASTGPNCPNGHPWATNAKFNYRGYRFCNACMEAKAQVRKDDPSTYTGACPKGHEFTRENTVITNWNSKVCLTCQRANYNKGRSVSVEQMQTLLVKARDGATASVMLGNRPSLRGKKAGIVDRPTLLKLLTLQTPECQELKQLLYKNSFKGIGAIMTSMVRFLSTCRSSGKVRRPWARGSRPAYGNRMAAFARLSPVNNREKGMFGRRRLANVARLS